MLILSTINANIRPVPWLTDKGVEFLEEFIAEHPSAKILEFGSGASTVWFAKKGIDLFSVEHDRKWYTLVKKTIESDPDCVPIHYFLRTRPYYSICKEFPDEYFDLILVDGRNRKGCVYAGLPKLKKGGVLMLDNAERRYYFPVYKHMATWERFDAPQIGPDQCGYQYRGWLTSWWIKPISE